MISQNIDPIKPTSNIMDPNVIGAEHIPLPTNSETHENRQKSSSDKLKDAVLISDDVKLLEESWTRSTQKQKLSAAEEKLKAIESKVVELREILSQWEKKKGLLTLYQETKIDKMVSQLEKQQEQLEKQQEQLEKQQEQLEKQQEQLEKDQELLFILLRGLDRLKNQLKRLEQQVNDDDDAIAGPFDHSRCLIPFLRMCLYIAIFLYIFSHNTY